MANLSKTLHINFYQNLSSIVEVMIKKFGVFYASQCTTQRNQCVVLLSVAKVRNIGCGLSVASVSDTVTISFVYY